jgi:hypothetical protein
MALNEGDKAIIREIAFEVGKIWMSTVDERIAAQELKCRLNLFSSRWKIVIMFGSTVLAVAGTATTVTMGILKIMGKI